MTNAQLDQLSVRLVEPSIAQARLITRQLEDTGIRFVHSSRSGMEALAALRDVPADLIISSLYLPDMTGTELVYAMRADDDLAHKAFMLISSETNPRYLDPVRQAGTICILPKPFNGQQLRGALLSTLEYLDPKTLQLDTEHIDIEDIKVLLVDDSPTARNYIRHILGNLGIRHFTEAQNGKQACALVEQEFFDLIVTDYNMPEMDGREFTEFVRTRSGQSSVPILMVSSEQNRNRLAAVQNAGVSALCDKPFDPRLVRDLILKLLASR